ncbi:MAG: AAA family ATPase [Ardenticatenaceae bacterium]|nr:AAA family ATPase [Ardenticatenaceae bacterium]
MRLRIHTLGPFQMLHGDTLVPDSAWKTQKNKLLCKILLTFRGHTLTKEQLMDWLWPGLDPNASGRNLRVAVSQLRRTLEPDLPRGALSCFVLTTGSGYTWDTSADYWLDVDEFARLVASPALPADSLPGQDAISQMQAASNLYRGDYLEEERYADWAVAERERLRELYFTLLTRFAEACARQGRYRRAVALCREVLAADRCRESVWCQLMLYHYHAGDLALALRAYEECRQALAEELDIEPFPETVTLADQIRHRAITSHRGIYPPSAAIERLRQLPLSLGRTPFVGRETEQAWLIDHLEHGARGGRVVLIEGEAGVGKSRLAAEVVDYARSRGITVLEGYCREGEGKQPYQPVVEALRLRLQVAETRGQAGTTWLPPFLPSFPLAWRTALAELFPELRLAQPDLPPNPPLPPEQEKARLFEALAQFMLAVSQAAGRRDPRSGDTETSRGLLFFLDDLHWADEATLEFLAFFARRAAQESVLVLGTLRSEEVAADEEETLARLLWGLKRCGVLYRLMLAPLSPAAVVRLLQMLSGSQTQGSVLGQRLYRETEGNPLFLLSVLQALFEDGLLTADEAGAWSAPAPDLIRLSGLPATMHEVIQRRLVRLGSEERGVLEAAAVLGREFRRPVLGQMRAWRRDILLDHLDHLTSVLLIREQGVDGHIFSHDKIRQVVYEDIGEDRRHWLHGKAGEALETHHASALDDIAGTLAYHFHQAGRPDRAFQYRLRAGWHATRLYAQAEAIGHYRSALAVVRQDGFRPAAEALREVHERLGDLYQAAGQYAPAQHEFEAAGRHAIAPADRVRLLYKLAHNENRLGHAGPSEEMLRQAVDEVDRLGVDQVGPLEAARVYARWAIMGSGWHGPSGAEHYARQAVGILERRRPEAFRAKGPLLWGEYDAIHSVLINAGEAFRHWGRWPEAADLFQQSLTMAERQGDLGGIGYSCHNRGDVVLAQGDLAGARAWYQRAAEAWSRSGETWVEMAAWTHLGLAWACEGRWPEAAGCLEHARTVGERMDPTEWLAEVYLWLSLAGLHCTGDEEQARVNRERAVAVAEAAGQALPDDVWHLALTAAEARAGHLDAAWQHYGRVQALWAQHPGRAFYSRWILEQSKPPPPLAG